ncbi:hypothetical protein T01_403, partial [Trichinella spiralis]
LWNKLALNLSADYIITWGIRPFVILFQREKRLPVSVHEEFLLSNSHIVRKYLSDVLILDNSYL